MTDNAIIYKIEFSDPLKTGIIIRPGTTDETTSLKLSGNGNLKWGEDFNESLLHVLENFSSDTAPANPTEGQIWFNSSDSGLSVYQMGSPNWLPVVTGSNITANFYSKPESDARYVEVAGDTMTGNLTMAGVGSPPAAVLGLPAVPTDDTEAASKKYVDDQIAVVTAAVAGSVTPGTITISAIDAAVGGTQPSGYLPCDGTSYLTATYPELFTQIEYMFGGSGANFNVPDLRGRFPLGHNESVGGVNRVNRVMPATLGYVDGSEFHTLSSGEMPSHSHTAVVGTTGSHSHTGSAATSGNHRHGGVLKIVGDCESGDGDREPGTNGNTSFAGDHTHTLSIDSNGNHNHTVTNNSTGSGNQHENTPPFEVVYFYIKT